MGKLHTIGEVAALLGVHTNTLRRWANANRIPSTRMPGGWRRWTPEQVEEIRRMMTQGVETPEAEQGGEARAA